MDWKALIGTVAPYLGAAVGGPLGAAAVGYVADAMGLSEKTEASIKSALSGVTPEQMLAIKNADQAFQVKMLELGYADTEAIAKLAVDDRNSARQREIAVKDNTPKILAYAITIGFFGVLVAMMSVTMPTTSRDVLNIMLGSLGTAWISIVAYYFGSSAGSQHKTELISQAPAIEK